MRSASPSTAPAVSCRPDRRLACRNTTHGRPASGLTVVVRSEEHTSELQSLTNLLCPLLPLLCAADLPPLPLHDALPIWQGVAPPAFRGARRARERELPPGRR